MPHWLIYAAAIAGRVLAGLIGCVCFYLAFFLYEDEQGLWQNRIENLWISIYDRANATDSTSTALFNKIGGLLKKGLNFIYGQRLLSVRAVISSINLSLFGCGIDVAFNLDPLSLTDHTFLRPNSEWYLNFGFAIFFLFVACLPSLTKRKRALVASASITVLFLILPLINILLNGHVSSLNVAPAVFILSTLCDFLAIALIRYLFAVLSKALTFSRIAISIVSLALIGFVVEVLPVCFKLRGIDFVPRSSQGSLVFGLTRFNFATGIFCAVPLLMLVFLLLHKSMWPLLSRAIYPLCRYSITGEKKVLLPFATLCLTFAFNLETTGIKDILKLFH
jgi:hypothetical protein